MAFLLLHNYTDFIFKLKFSKTIKVISKQLVFCDIFYSNASP